MRTLFRRKRSEGGSVLAGSLVFAGVMGVSAVAMIQLASHRTAIEDARYNSNQAYYHAESAMSWAVQKIADANAGGSTAAFLGQYSIGGGTLPVSYLQSLAADSSSGLGNVWVTIGNHPSGVTNLYQVTVSAKVSSRVRSLQATVRKNAPSLIFDYEYFLNNWGWWWGNSITGNGDVRANWDFDFRYTPTLNGSALAAGRIASSMVPVDPYSGTPPFNGTAGSDPLGHVHSGAPRLNMPNLLDFSYYQAQATARGGTLFIGSTQMVAAVHTNASTPGMYLKGTATAPIKINGPVVIPGDVIISGPITGTGTLYVGGNLYVAGDMTYANGPSFSTPPTQMSQSSMDNWVSTANAAGKDLIAFGVRGSVFGGDVNSSDWETWCYSASGWGLSGLGNESQLGPDGIRGTPDDNTSYWHYVGTNYVNSASFDADGNGAVNANYNLSNDIKMTDNRANKIQGYPKSGSDPVSYSTIATCNYNRMDGVFYCNHATACRLAKGGGVVWNGSIICRDEAIVFNDSLRFNYDPRIHSRYSNDPNRFIDLGLPVANLVRVDSINEIVPVNGFYASN